MDQPLEPDRALDARVAEAMGLVVDHEFDEPAVHALRDRYDEWGMLPHYSTNMSDAWIVVAFVTHIPQSLEEAERAANTRFMAWWERTALWSYSEQEAATAICEAFLDAVSKGPL